MATFYDNLRATNKETLDKASGMNALDRTIFLNNAKKNGKLQTKEEVDSVVQNTFHTDKDGVSYGVGNDGNTYSYELWNNQVTNFKPLTAEEQRAAISKITDGAVEVDPMVENQQSLTDIFRSVSRMYNKGDNLTPDKVTISDMYPGSYNFVGAQGRAFKSRDDSPDEVEISGLGFPKFRKAGEKTDYESGFASTGKYPGEHVPTHELSHTAGFAAERVVDKWLEKKKEEAEKNKNKYPVGELFKKAISNFFGQKYEIDEEKSIGNQLLNEIYSRYDKWEEEDRNAKGRQIYDFLNVAAENAGFDSVAEAAKSISGYAGKTYPDYTYNGDKLEIIGESVNGREVFAEAYTDVLINGDDAAAFSKELVKLYSDYVDRWAKRTGKDKEERVKEIKEMFEILPEFKTNSQATPVQRFRQNYRRLVTNNKK